ncbi:MAG: hypothetical protein JWN76_2610 [Chitinophagaceae bacterium]|nr:hypothetical protein [Chitinophagaceae bacterium]
MQKFILFLFFITITVLQSFSQTGTITGIVKDSASGKTLALATVTVFKAKDTAIVTYRLTNADGAFKIPGLPLQMPLRVMVTYSGYSAYRQDFVMTSPNFSADTIKLISTSKQLDDVIVFAERPPVVIKNDTIEFNASAFKTLPNALVEDLLKKLPGVQVDAEGNIAVNGKAVNRILVDGKTFFGGDPKMATRNLPANVIDKVQVMDDKEEMLRNGDDNLNNVGKVVNITLKKGVKKGWFGKVYAGAGTKNNFEGGGIANIFRDTLQMSVLGYANSLNKPGFGYSDLMQAAGLERSSSVTGSRSTSIWTTSSGSGIAVNGISFGGAQNYGGVSTSRGAGININHAPDLKRSIYAQYFYGNILIDRRTETSTQQFNGDSVINNHTMLTGDVVTHAHNIGLGIKLKPDSVTTIIATANYMIGLQDEDRFSDISSLHNKLGSLSTGNILQDNIAVTYNYRHSFTYTRLSKTKKGRRYTITHGFDQNNRFNDYSTGSALHFIYPSVKDTALNQLRQERIPRAELSAAFNYSDPLAKTVTLRLGGRYEYTRLYNTVYTFNSNGGGYDILNTQLSNTFDRESHRFYIITGLEYKWKDFTITPAARVLFQQIHNNFSVKNINQKNTALLPGLTVVYKQLNLNYNKDISLPPYTYLLPVNDNTNPYFISRGNESLIPAERQNFSAGFYFNNPKKNLSASLNGGASVIKNDIVAAIVVDNKGVQTSTPVNVNGSSSWWANYNINRQYKQNQKFIVSWNMGAYYGYNSGRLLFNGDVSMQSTWNINQWAGINMNFNDRFEWNNNYSLGYNFTQYTSSRFKKLEVLNHYLNTEMILRYPKHLIWETSANYQFNSQVYGGLPKELFRWNAALNITMLKDEKGVLRLSMNDLLNQNRNISSYANRNMLTTSETNTLGRYFMATFTYNIRTTGVKKKVGGERLFLF